MSRSHQYHRPNAPDISGEDPESDLDLDLDELAPSGKELPESSWGQRDGQRRLHSNGPIPLQNLRAGALRASRRRTRQYEGGRDDGADVDQLFSYEHDGEDTPDGSNPLEDATPLLRHGTEEQPRNSRTGFRDKVGVIARLLSGSKGPVLGQEERRESVGQTEKSGSPRTFTIGQPSTVRFPPNAVSNAKYTPWSFLPRTLYYEFSFFINLYFLLIALSQIIRPLRIGYLSTYIVPLAFVLTITLGKEALDDIARRRRDTEANNEEYIMLRIRNSGDNPQAPKTRERSKRAKVKARQNGVKNPSKSRIGDIGEEEEATGQDSSSYFEVDEVRAKSKDLKVGDILKIGKDQRVPADLVILKSYTAEASAAIYQPSEPSGTAPESLVGSTDVPIMSGPAITSRPSAEADGVGETFIRTDQLDGETDWKLRLASPLTQTLNPEDFPRITITAGKPDKKVNVFLGSIELAPDMERSQDTQNQPQDQSVVSAPLTIDNTAWANTVIASSATVLGAVVYTGSETRQAMSTSSSRSKTGLLEIEINNLTKILCALTLTLSVVLVALEGFNHREDQKWYISITRFLILFSTIIPISLRVNLDLGKSVYARFIERDPEIPEAVVRTSTIPEDLGRIEYLLSDKTGTLTQNEMELKKIHVGTVSYAGEAMEEVSTYVKQGFSSIPSLDSNQSTTLVTPSSLLNIVASGATTRTRREIGSRVRDVVLALALCHNVTPTTQEENGRNVTAYQASSPDEIAIVRWTESVGLRVIHRDRKSIALQSVNSGRVCVRVRILEVFPFTSEGKRMGIIIQFLTGSESPTSSTIEAGEIWFYQKGADTVMTTIVAANDWLDEETANMAREGLRTLVVGRRKLSAQQYRDFAKSYKEASLSLQARDASMAASVREHLEHNLELLGITGVEDKLQREVKPSLELLRNAGIKIWMLTGDKVETARCVAVSSKLVSRSQVIQTVTSLPTLVRSNAQAATNALSLLNSNPDSTALLIDGDSLSHFLHHHRHQFISLAVLLPAVIACRCSPTQKADIALLIRAYTKKRIACIGDGGNDVSMIQAADVGVGIVGKEGRQASLAADFSITQFHHLTKLLVWHGRNSYKRSAKLAQFVIHRGLIISICQTVYSISTSFEPNALFPNWLLVGYATVYTMAPVFSLVLDRDVDERLANIYPELYKELTPGKSLSYRTFAIWLLVSIYQGTSIQILAQLLTRSVDNPRMVSVSFTALIINELCMVAFEVTTWHWIMAASLVGTLLVYVGSVPFLGDYFDLEYVWSWGFVWRVVVVAAVSLVPVYGGKSIRRWVRPPSYRKVRGV